MMFWVSIICLAYYFIVGNSLTIIAFNMSEKDRKKYHDHIFTCIPARWMKWFISLLLVLLNSLNICSLPAVFYNLRKKLQPKSKILSNRLITFYYKYIYIYFAFEGIPFLIIYSLTLSRSILEDKSFDLVILIFGCVNVVCLFGWFVYIKREYRFSAED